jgi:hypothetical protein
MLQESYKSASSPTQRFLWFLISPSRPLRIARPQPCKCFQIADRKNIDALPFEPDPR